MRDSQLKMAADICVDEWDELDSIVKWIRN